MSPRGGLLRVAPKVMPMKVTLLCFGHLKDHLPVRGERNAASIDLPAGADVSAAIVALGLPRGHVFMVLVNGRRADLSTELHEGDEVTLMPPFSGG